MAVVPPLVHTDQVRACVHPPWFPYSLSVDILLFPFTLFFREGCKSKIRSTPLAFRTSILWNLKALCSNPVFIYLPIETKVVALTQMTHQPPRRDTVSRHKLQGGTVSDPMEARIVMERVLASRGEYVGFVWLRRCIHHFPWSRLTSPKALSR